jgi:hypothetical protein
MVQLTSKAAEEIAGLRPRCLPDHRILRITRDTRRPHGPLRLTFVAVAREGDHVGESQGIPVCVGDDLHDQLSGMVLDVRDGDSGGALYLRAA